MSSVKCEHCNEPIEWDVYVINRYTYCSTCFYEWLMPQIKMDVNRYLDRYKALKDR